MHFRSTTKLLATCFVFITLCSCAHDLRTDGELLTVIKVYAEKYQPNVRNGVQFDVDTPPPPVTDTLAELSRRRQNSHNIYVALVLLSLYRNHLKYAHQSYELRLDDEGHKVPSNPLVREFCRLAGLKPRLMEFLPSSAVYDWVLREPKLQQSFLIQEEMKQINVIEADITYMPK